MFLFLVFFYCFFLGTARNISRCRKMRAQSAASAKSNIRVK